MGVGVQLSGLPRAAMASGLCRVHTPTTSASAISATITPQVHQRMRYRAAGTDWRTNRRTEWLLTSRVPVRRPRAVATREDNSAMSCGSGAAERTRDR